MVCYSHSLCVCVRVCVWATLDLQETCIFRCMCGYPDYEYEVFHGLIFQDIQMKQIFSAYTELICINATYKLFELRFPLYIIMVEDGNGYCEVAAAFFKKPRSPCRKLWISFRSLILIGHLFVS